MGKLFLPAETSSLWDAGSRTLTVYVGEHAYVGYEGTKAEIDDIEFSAWGNGTGECATEVYTEGPGRISTYIKTDHPMTLTLEVKSKDRRLVQPITIYVRLRPTYRAAAPVGQMDETACWAACLSWWTQVLPDRRTLDQKQLLVAGHGMWNRDGTINPDQLQGLTAKLGIRMRCQKIGSSQLNNLMGHFPMLLGFTASGGFGHMNVLCGYDAEHGTVDTMEPMYPDPIFNSGYKAIDGGGGVPLFVNSDGDSFKYTGAVRTGLSLESFAPMKAGGYWIGYPQEYLMP